MGRLLGTQSHRRDSQCRLQHRCIRLSTQAVPSLMTRKKRLKRLSLTASQNVKKSHWAQDLQEEMLISGRSKASTNRSQLVTSSNRFVISLQTPQVNLRVGS